MIKQHITVNQLNELNDKGKEKLRKRWKPQWGDRIYDGEELIWEEDNDGAIAFDEETKMTSPGGTVREWEKSYPLLSIGQCIEFLDEHNKFMALHAPDRDNSKHNPQDIGHEDDEAYWDDRNMSNPYWWQVEKNSVGSYSAKEPIDALWAAVREILEEGE